MRKLISIAFLVLAILVFSQVLWGSQFIKQERTNFQSSITKELKQVIDFHATEKFGIEDYENPNKRDSIMEEDNSTDETDKKTLAVLHLDTKDYKQGKKSFSELIYKTFIELALAKNEFSVQRVDSLFRKILPILVK